MSELAIHEVREVDVLDAHIIQKLATLWESGDVAQREIVEALALDLFAQNKSHQDLVDALKVADVSHPVVRTLYDELLGWALENVRRAG